jgi:hypothetical protein
VAVTREQARRDLYDNTTLREHDERIRVGDWVYYVRGVRSRPELTVGSVWTWSGLGDVFVFPVLWRGFHRIRQRGRWGVGVVRLGAADTYRDVTPRVVHYEVLARGEDPTERIAQLVSRTRTNEAP